MSYDCLSIGARGQIRQPAGWVRGGPVDSRESIVVDSETWGAMELFEVISSRYFELGNEGPIPPSWEVNGKDGSLPGEQLVVLNRHLAPMGMVGTLEDSNPPVLSISSLPSGQVVLRNWQQALVWIAMSGLLTIIGAQWVSRYGHGSNPLGVGTWGQSTLYFALPMVIEVEAGNPNLQLVQVTPTSGTYPRLPLPTNREV